MAKSPHLPNSALNSDYLIPFFPLRKELSMWLGEGVGLTKAPPPPPPKSLIDH